MFRPTHTGNVSVAPARELCLTVLSEDITVNVSNVNAELSGDKDSETGGVEICTGTDDLAGRKSGPLCNLISNEIARIGDYHDDTLVVVLHDAVCDDVSELDVLLSKVKSCLAFFSGDTCCDDDAVCILNITVVAGVNIHIANERKSVADIESFTKSLFLIDINKYELRAELLHCDCESCSRSYCACADDGDFGSFLFIHHTSDKYNHNTSRVVVRSE